LHVAKDSSVQCPVNVLRISCDTTLAKCRQAGCPIIRSISATASGRDGTKSPRVCNNHLDVLEYSVRHAAC
jgi:hypothetical protein